MSDEDRDVDIESDEDDDCLGLHGSSEASGGFMTQAEKRAHHNALERKRRDHIKESFHSLRDSVPALQGEKVKSVHASRAQILKQATEYIQFMTKKNNSHQQDIEDLRRQNNQLESQVRAFEKAKSAGTFAAQSATLEGNSSINSRGATSYAGNSGSESSDSEPEMQTRRKKLKT